MCNNNNNKVNNNNNIIDLYLYSIWVTKCFMKGKRTKHTQLLDSCLLFWLLTSVCFRYYEATGGFDQIVKAFQKNLKKTTILLNSKVNKITQSGDDVTVSYQKKGKHSWTTYWCFSQMLVLHGGVNMSSGQN